MFIVEFTVVISGDPFPETGRLHDDPIKVSNVLTSSIKTFLESPRFVFQGYVSYSIWDCTQELGQRSRLEQ